jgi:predicted amidohydrolase
MKKEMSGIYYNTAAVIDADGKYLGKYRKTHIPHVAPGFWEKFYFRPGNLGIRRSIQRSDALVCISVMTGTFRRSKVSRTERRGDRF